MSIDIIIFSYNFVSLHANVLKVLCKFSVITSNYINSYISHQPAVGKLKCQC